MEGTMILPFIHFLNEDEQLLIEGFGGRRIINGPGTIFSPPFTRTTKMNAILLNSTQYAKIKDNLTGEIKVIKGPTLYFRESHEELIKIFNALTLTYSDYVKVVNNEDGTIRIEKGEQTLFLEPHESILEKLKAITLKNNEYVKIIDNESGKIRVESGECKIFLKATESVLHGPDTGVNIDEHQAVLVRDTNTGNIELVQKKQVFFPSATQEIVEIRPKILLADHETVVVMDPDGLYQYYSGKDKKRSFFIEPYSRLVEFTWSAGLHKNKRDLKITHIDTRPKFMWYEFAARTSDNVELLLNVTFFWQIEDVKEMVMKTDDAPGDICAHARSRILQKISKINFEKFLADFNNIVHSAVLEEKDDFYKTRGCRIHSVEVRSLDCKDEAIQHILEEIIKETTNRLNRIQKQKTTNEVQLQELKGKLETEKNKSELLKIQEKNKLLEAQTAGKAESNKVNAFLDDLKDLTFEQKMQIFSSLKSNENIKSLSSGSAHLFLTPEDVNLRIQTKE
jgi:regulator of protease activity HflC (stomatin/prohibitin superfamily)